MNGGKLKLVSAATCDVLNPYVLFSQTIFCTVPIINYIPSRQFEIKFSLDRLIVNWETFFFENPHHRINCSSSYRQIFLANFEALITTEFLPFNLFNFHFINFFILSLTYVCVYTGCST